jgi:hypothetical protein
MKKEAWLKLVEPISINEFPRLPCPTCSNGELILDLSSLRFRASKDQYKRDVFWKDDFEQNTLLRIFFAIGTALDNMQWKQSRFIGFLVCSPCQESVAITGRAEVPSAFQKMVYKEHIQPTRILAEYFSPHIPIFNIKSQLPEDVRSELAKSFSLYHTDTAAAGNRLRAAVERLLDSQGIEPGRDLYGRIQQFAKKELELSELLSALRLLGNEASHEGNVSKADLLDAYAVFECIAEQLFERQNKLKTMKALSNEIIDRFNQKA